MSDSEGVDWQQVIWREWRNCDDRKLAEQLFALVANRPVGPGATATIIFLGALYGATVGLLLGLLLPKNGILSGQLPSPITLLLSWLFGGSAGAGLGLLIRYRLGTHLRWWQWLERLSPRMVRHPFRSGDERGTVLGLGMMFGIAGGPLGALIMGLLYADLPRGQRSSGRERRWASSGEIILISVFGGTLTMLAIVAVVTQSFFEAALPLLLFLLLTGQGIGLVFGIDLGLIGGLLFGLASGLLSGVLLNMVASPQVGLVVGLIVLLVNGVFSVIRTSPYAWTWRGLWAWWRSRPATWELELALQQVVQAQQESPVWPNVLRELARKKAEPGPIRAMIKDLSSKHWRQRFLAAHTLVSMGGEVIPELRITMKTPALSRTSAWLLRSIARDTQHRLASRIDELLCPHCLVRFAALPISVPGPDLTYYGCRACGQSREFLEWPGEVVAVLDEGMGEEQAKAEGSLRVNWLVRRELFDFDRVEIVRASDEAVERFAMVVGNDTDPVRKARYPKTPYLILDDRLGENERRILDRLFGQVKDEYAKKP